MLSISRNMFSRSLKPCRIFRFLSRSSIRWRHSGVVRVTAGLGKVMAAYHRVYDSRHLQADCQEPRSAPEPYTRQSSMDTFTFLSNTGHLTSVIQCITSLCSADYMTLLPFADECHAVCIMLLQWLAAAAINRCLLLAVPTAANPPQRHAAVNRWDRQTDRRTMYQCTIIQVTTEDFVLIGPSNLLPSEWLCGHSKCKLDVGSKPTGECPCPHTCTHAQMDIQVKNIMNTSV